MKKLLFALVLVAPVMSRGQTAFNGTWVFSPQSAQFTGKPITILLQNGTYRCDSCAPNLEVQADGKDHARTGSPYADAVNVQVLDDHTIVVIGKKAGKEISTTRDTVSEDGKTLTTEWSVVANNGQPGSGKLISTRVVDGPAGAHKVSGSWRPDKMDDTSGSILKVTFTVTDDGMSMSDLTGDSYTAKFDGKDYPYEGDPGITSVSLKRIDANTIEETDKHDGNAVLVSRMTVSSDGQTMEVETNYKLRGSTSKFEAKKQ